MPYPNRMAAGNTHPQFSCHPDYITSGAGDEEMGESQNYYFLDDFKCLRTIFDF